MSDQTETGPRAELTTLLPPPADPQLAGDRHALLRNTFLARIQDAPAPARRRPRWALVGAPIAATVLVAGAVAGVVLKPSPGPAPSSPGVQAAVGDGAVFLNRMALVTTSGPKTTIGAGQFAYIKSRVAWGTGPANGTAKLEPLHDREIWIPQTGSTGLVVEAGESRTMTDMISNADATDLPTDPDTLLRKIYKETAGTGDSPDGEAFTTIGDLLREALMPPETTAALYRAAAKIPGVVLEPDVVDAAGRHGGAVARVERGERTEWIFDKKTGAFLGERSYRVKDGNGLSAGTLTGTTAVLERAAVDKLGERP